MYYEATKKQCRVTEATYPILCDSAVIAVLFSLFLPNFFIFRKLGYLHAFFGATIGFHLPAAHTTIRSENLRSNAKGDGDKKNR